MMGAEDKIVLRSPRANDAWLRIKHTDSRGPLSFKVKDNVIPSLGSSLRRGYTSNFVLHCTSNSVLHHAPQCRDKAGFPPFPQLPAQPDAGSMIQAASK